MPEVKKLRCVINAELPLLSRNLSTEKELAVIQEIGLKPIIKNVGRRQKIDWNRTPNYKCAIGTNENIKNEYLQKMPKGI